MKRDMDLARRILLDVEECKEAVGGSPIHIECEGHSEEEVSYHVKLLEQAGLLDIVEHSDSNGMMCIPTRLTWAGHEFLDATRKDSLWQKVKSVALEKTGGLGFEVIKQLATKFVLENVLGGRLPD